MRVLVVGAAGKVGTILRPALEREHDCVYFDRRPVPGSEGRTILGDVTGSGLDAALDGCDAVVYLAMGTVGRGADSLTRIRSSFDVNLRGWYTTLRTGLAAGIRRWVYASSLSVYRNCVREPVDERTPPDAWAPYGMSKRLAEHVCEAAVQEYPDATVIALRLILPRTAEEWATLARTPGEDRDPADRVSLAPGDVQRLFLAALTCDVPGASIVQASGDVHGERLPNDRATALLGWAPRERLPS